MINYNTLIEVFSHFERSGQMYRTIFFHMPFVLKYWALEKSVLGACVVTLSINSPSSKSLLHLVSEHLSNENYF